MTFPDRRGDRRARARAALLELLLASFSLPAAAGYLLHPDLLAQTAVHAVSPAGAVAWLIALTVGSVVVLAGHLAAIDWIERVGVSLLGIAAVAYAASLLPARGDRAGFVVCWMLALSFFLLARVRRSTTP